MDRRVELIAAKADIQKKMDSSPTMTNRVKLMYVAALVAVEVELKAYPKAN